MTYCTNVNFAIIEYDTYWLPIVTAIKPPTKNMKFQGRFKGAIVKVTHMPISIGVITTCVQHWLEPASIPIAKIRILKTS